MPNYVPKEKKPVLNREAIKKDLKKRYAPPHFYHFVVFVTIAIFISIAIGGMVMFFTENGFFMRIYSLVGTLAAVFVACVFTVHFADLTIIPILIALDKFNVCTDTIHHKVQRERVRDWFNTREHNGDRYRYPCVLYFNKLGRYELCFDSSNHYDEYDSIHENRIERMLDSYELEKDYFVVSFGKKKPRIALVYDPDKYDVQL